MSPEREILHEEVAHAADGTAIQVLMLHALLESGLVSPLNIELEHLRQNPRIVRIRIVKTEEASGAQGSQ